jgi:hypothetical protein
MPGSTRSRAANSRRQKPPRVTTVTTTQTYLRDSDDATEAVRFITIEGGKVKAQRVYTYNDSTLPISEWEECNEVVFKFDPADLKKAVEAVTI